MNMIEAMAARHTVRKYLDKPLPAEVREQLCGHVRDLNERYRLNVSMICDNTQAFSPVLKLVLAKGVKNYFVLAGPDEPGCDERIGRCGSELMLFAQTLGLNTWWVGGTFSRAKVATVAQVPAGCSVSGIIAVGYGAIAGKPHQSKAPDKVASYEGEAPAWFNRGVAAALLAPTAMNKQAFMIAGAGNKVRFTCDNGAFTGVDSGIVKYHFELGAGAENFVWE